MARTIERVRVTLAGDDFYPQTFRLEGRSIRVLFVEGMRTVGAERIFRVRTVEGAFELAQQTVTQVWTLRRQPTWWSRAISGGEPVRYQPAVGRNRVSRAVARGQAKAHPQAQPSEHSSEGGEHASGFALVR